MLEALEPFAPDAVAGYARIRAHLARDGALPASTKALFIATAAIARGADDLARAEIGRGRELGAGDELVALCAAALLLSRGEVACGRLLAAAGPPLGELGAARVPAARRRAGVLPRVQRRRAAGTHARAARARAGRVRRLLPGVHQAVLSSDPATDLLAELVLCTINAAELESGFIAIHAATAGRRGVSLEQLVEAVLCAIPVTSVAAWAAAAAALFPDA